MDARRDVLGADRHDYVLGAPVAEEVVARFEAVHGALPPSYRRFIREVGDGGAGPGVGLFPFGERDGVPFADDPEVGSPSGALNLDRPIDGAVPVARFIAGTDVWLALGDGALYGVTSERAYLLKPQRDFAAWYLDWLRRVVKAC